MGTRSQTCRSRVSQKSRMTIDGFYVYPDKCKMLFRAEAMLRIENGIANCSLRFLMLNWAA
jgi:hypothetical protein